MTTPHRPASETASDRAATPFEVGRAELAAGRRTLLKLGGGVAVSTAAIGLSGDAAGAAGRIRTRKRAYVLVIDGCRPDELRGDYTPNLFGLRNQGSRFQHARSLPIMETIPNHVMMMTGVRPDRSGVPANSIYDRKLGDIRELDRPSDITGDTLIERMNRRGLRTATVLSKDYLYGIFGTRATARWEPFPIIPISGHAPDEFTIRAARQMVEELDPHLMFVNLGDIDRYGHTDLTGPLGIRAQRRLALTKTDAYVGGFVDMLKARGTWKDSLVVVLADHSMDFSTPDRVVSLSGPISEDPLLRGKVQIADNGGADIVYWTGSATRRDEAVARIRRIAGGTPGVLASYDRKAKWLRLGPQAGDVIVFCKQGWRFSDPDPRTSNPIPGNHGHPTTQPIPFFLSGGHPAVPKRQASPHIAHTTDVAPTVAHFFGLRTEPRGGYDGHSRL